MKSPVLKKSLARWYAEHYYEVEDEVLTIFEKLETPLLDRLIPRNCRILDAMCGRGRHALRYAEHSNITANDLNPHMVAFVAKAAKAARLKIMTTNEDVTKLPFKEGEFDYTFAMYSSVGTIPEAEDRQKAICEMARVTKDSVIIHAHNRLDAWFDRKFFRWVLRQAFFPGKLGRGGILQDYNGLNDMFNYFYTPGEFRKSFKRAGLEVVEEYYMDYDSGHFLLGPLRKWKADGFIFVGKVLSSTAASCME